MDRFCLVPRCVAHALGRPARRGGEGDLQSDLLHDSGDEADDGGLARAGAASDHERALIQRGEHGVLLLTGELELLRGLNRREVEKWILDGPLRKVKELFGNIGFHSVKVREEDSLRLADKLLHRLAMRN
ncbi:hypothetical protein SDC9_165880 [bioreactor metagenome]|uniref:Uncharacterized protein n=1 Tax=bioreactor metagenome TaxID=1076179 RepID=A0A645FY01_9ZZZZ